MFKLFIDRYWTHYHIAKYIPLSLIKKSLMPLGIYAKGHVLDVGCAHKPHEDIFKPANVRQYIGIELLESGAKQFIDVYGTAMELPFKKGVFDMVLNTAVLEHIENPFTCFRETARVLKKQGIFILIAPQTSRLHGEYKNGFGYMDYFRFTRSGLKYLAEANGLEVMEINAVGGFTAVLSFLVQFHIFYRLLERSYFIKFIFLPLIIGLPWLAMKLDPMISQPDQENVLFQCLVARKK